MTNIHSLFPKGLFVFLFLLHRTTPISLEHGDTPRHDSDDDEKGVYLEPYRASPWVYVSPGDEAKVSDTRRLPSVNVTKHNEE